MELKGLILGLVMSDQIDQNQILSFRQIKVEEWKIFCSFLYSKVLNTKWKAEIALVG